MRIVVDRAKCTALGNCEAIAPEFFEVNDEGTLDILQEEFSAERRDLIERAVAGCPMAALRIEESP